MEAREADGTRVLVELVSLVELSRDRDDLGGGGGGGRFLLLGRVRVLVETVVEAEIFRSDRYLRVLSAVMGVKSSQLLSKLTVRIKNRYWLHFLVTILSFVWQNIR